MNSEKSSYLFKISDDDRFPKTIQCEINPNIYKDYYEISHENPNLGSNEIEMENEFDTKNHNSL